MPVYSTGIALHPVCSAIRSTRRTYKRRASHFASNGSMRAPAQWGNEGVVSSLSPALHARGGQKSSITILRDWSLRYRKW